MFDADPASAGGGGSPARRRGQWLRQAAGLDPVLWPDALAEVWARFEPAGVDWWLAVRGAQVMPRDMALIVSSADLVRAGELLADGLIEPAARGEWHLSLWWGRAFVHAQVELVGGVTAALQVVRWRGWDIRVQPLGLQRAVSARRGLTAGRRHRRPSAAATGRYRTWLPSG